MERILPASGETDAVRVFNVTWRSRRWFSLHRLTMSSHALDRSGTIACLVRVRVSFEEFHAIASIMQRREGEARTLGRIDR